MSNATARLSVALCTYNGERYLREQLDSLVAQRRKPEEVIICDDCSTDSTMDIARGFAARAPFPVRIFAARNNVGSTKNFERAIVHCTGELIALADQDDVWCPEKLARSEQALLAAPRADLVFSDAYITDEALRPLDMTLWDDLRFGADLRSRIQHDDAFHVLFNKTVVTGATMVFRSRIRDLVLPIPATVVHDNWIALLVSAVSGVILIDEPLMYYRQHGSNQIGTHRVSLSWLWRHNRRLRHGGREAIADWCQEAARRLEGARERLRHPEGIELLRDKATHGQARANLPANRFRRMPIILNELQSGRYARYSTGAVSAVIDLVV